MPTHIVRWVVTDTTTSTTAMLTWYYPMQGIQQATAVSDYLSYANSVLQAQTAQQVQQIWAQQTGALSLVNYFNYSISPAPAPTMAAPTIWRRPEPREGAVQRRLDRQHQVAIQMIQNQEAQFPFDNQGPSSRPRPHPGSERAHELLLSFLTDEQRAQLAETGSFIVIGRHARYRINRGTIANIDVLGGKKHTRVMSRLCVHPEDSSLPVEDVMLSQLLHLMSDEDRLRRTANEHPGEAGVIAAARRLVR